ncbi:MAG: AsmA family protein, partial [Chitinophagales bacterium]
MKKLSSVLLKVLKISGISLLALIALLFLAPMLFPDTVSDQIRSWTNQSIKGELNFSKSRLSFFNHFPSLTLTLYDVSLKGSAPFDKDTLLSSRKLGFGINLKKLVFDHTVHINKIFLTDALVNVQVNEKGEANYNIYKSGPAAKKDNLPDTSAASLSLERITIADCRLMYNDKSIPMKIEADHLYYEGKGDLSQSIFDLASHIKTDSLSFSFNNENYITRKAIDADLITRVNTQTLALIFQKNDLQMNKLALQFSGKLDFLSNGYDMDFSLASKQADLYQLITALPPEYIAWLQKTTVKGVVDLRLNLKGRYIASSREMPDLGLKLNLKDGFIAYENAKLPVSNLKGEAEIQLPRLDPEQ